MKKLVIAIDCDDVLIASAHTTISVYNRNYSAQLTPEYYYGPASVATWGTDDEAVAVSRVEKIQMSPEYMQIEPYPDAVAVINRLAAHHELHLVTGRPDHLQEVTLSMIDQHFPGCFSTIQHTNFYNQQKKRTKGEACRSLGVDVLVDDHLVHCNSVLEHGLQEVIVFGDLPWNQAEVLPKGMLRCNDWRAVEKEITRIACR